MSNSMVSSYLRPEAFSPAAGPATRTSTPIAELPQSQIDAIIRTKRKAREPKACYPCHTRKVKCDRKLPCDGCVKRDHADLCSYERPSKKRQIPVSQSFLNTARGGDPAAGGTGADSMLGSDVQVKSESAEQGAGLSRAGGRVSVPREDWENVCNKLKEMEQTISSLRAGLEQIEEGRVSAIAAGELRSTDASQRSEQASPEREGIHTANTLGEGTVHLGSRSVLAYILNKSGSLQAQALLEGGILPKLGLDNETATYPFVDLWSSDTSTFDVSAVCSALPSDEQIRELVLSKSISGMMSDFNAGFSISTETLQALFTPCSWTYPGSSRIWRRYFGIEQPLVACSRLMMVKTSPNGRLGRAWLFSGYFLRCWLQVASRQTSPARRGNSHHKFTVCRRFRLIWIRRLTVTVCCSYQCLRMTNFVSQPTIEAMKTLLIIGNVLSYNMNPGVSYVLLGMGSSFNLLEIVLNSHRNDSPNGFGARVACRIESFPSYGTIHSKTCMVRILKSFFVRFILTFQGGRWHGKTVISRCPMTDRRRPLSANRILPTGLSPSPVSGTTLRRCAESSR